MAQTPESSKHSIEEKLSDLQLVEKNDDVCVAGVGRLTALPKHVTFKIMQYLSQSDLCHCAQMCRGLSAVAGDNQLWKGIWEEVVLREPTLKNFYDESQGCDYKELCKRVAETKGKWKTGQGVTTFTNNNIKIQSYIKQVVISSHYVLVTTIYSDPIYVFSSETGEYLHDLCGAAKSVIMSKDEQMAAAYHKVYVFVWKVETGSRLHTFNHTDDVTNIALQDKMLSSMCASGDLYVWSLESGFLMHQLHAAVGMNDFCHQMVMENHLLATYHQHFVIILWDAKLGHQLMKQKCGGQGDYFNQILVDSATHSLVGMARNAIRVWDTETCRHRGLVRAAQRHDYNCMLMQGAHLLIHSSFNHHAIIVFSMMGRGRPTFLYSVDDGPIIRSSDAISDHILKVVSSELVAVTSEQCHCVYLFDLKNRKFVRKMGEGQGEIVGLNASFSKLQVVRKAEGSDILTYASYDYDAQ